MIDPESARITWMGGYTGASSFIVVIDYDRVLLLDIERTGRGFAGAACEKYALQQKLPPRTDAERNPPPEVRAATGTSGFASAQLTSAASGLTLRAMPDGAYVSGVSAGSPAAIAGLTPGMVIGLVNAIPLGGMGDAMLKVIDAAGGTATLSIVGGKTLKLGGPK